MTFQSAICNPQSAILAYGLWGLPLWTAAAAGAPILIHLLNRMRYDRVRWAAMEFLLAGRRRTKRRMQLEQLLLLLMRVLIMLLLSTAFARIAWGPDPVRNAAAASGGPESHVILLDTGISMGAKVPGGTGLSAAQGEIAKVLRGLRPGDELAVVLAGATPEVLRQPAPPAEGEAETLTARLGELRPVDVESDLSAALSSLFRAAADGTETGLLTLCDPKKRKVLHIISDFRRSGWLGAGSGGATGGEAPPPAEAKPSAKAGPQPGGSVASAETLAAIRKRFGAKIDPIDVAAGAEASPANLAITALSVKESELTVFRGSTVPADRDVDFLVRVRNFGDRPATATLDAVVEGRRVPGPEVTVAPRAESTEVLKLRFPPGRGGPRPADVVVMLAAPGGAPYNDALEADNRRMITVRVVDTLRVLLVTGDVTPEDFEKGFSLPLLSAMTPRPREGDTAPTALTVTHLSERAFADLAADEAKVKSGVLADTDCLVLSNVEQFPGALVPELSRFLSAGGLAAMFVGDKLRAAATNEELWRPDLKILPAPLEQAVNAKTTLAADSIDYSDPVLSDLRFMPEPLGPVGVVFNRYVRLRSDRKPEAGGAPAAPGGAAAAAAPSDPDVKVLARYADAGFFDGKAGNPAIIRRRVGKGGFVLFTSTAGEPWNDWATDRQRRGSFVILVQGLVQAAAPARVAQVQAGTAYDADILPAAVGSDRASRAAELRRLSMTRRDDPPTPAGAGRGEWRPISDIQSFAEEAAASVRLADTRYAGIYRISSGAAGNTPVEMFAVNPSVSASDLLRLDDAQRRAFFPDEEVRSAEAGNLPDAARGPGDVIERDDPNDDRPTFTERDQHICQLLLGAMMFLMVLETWLARKFAHYE
jgi:hypothetical protein